MSESTTTPKKGDLNGDPKRVFDKIIFTAEAASRVPPMIGGMKNFLSLTRIAKLGPSRLAGRFKELIKIKGNSFQINWALWAILALVR